MPQHLKTVCIAGKNDIACLFLEWVIAHHPNAANYVIVSNKDDCGKHTWQRSLKFTASKLGIPEVTLEELYPKKELCFLSLEFDRIISPCKFTSQNLYNVHFSNLPKYRGTATSVWPLVHGEKTSGVTLHRIDAGIDTGEVISQHVFPIGKWWNAYDLYKSYLSNGLELIQREFLKILKGCVNSNPQAITGATYFGRSAIDFSSPKLNFKQTAWQVNSMIRGYTFPVYQYPSHPVAGPILDTRISKSPSQKKAGTYHATSRWKGHLSTLDYDLEVILSPYAEMNTWFQGNATIPDDLSKILTILDLDQVDGNGWTPLAIASYHGNKEACRMLLNNGADPNGSGLRGTTPLMYAKDHFVNTQDSTVFSLLLAMGSDSEREDVHGKSIWHYIKKKPKSLPLLTILKATNTSC